MNPRRRGKPIIAAAGAADRWLMCRRELRPSRAPDEFLVAGNALRVTTPRDFEDMDG